MENKELDLTVIIPIHELNDKTSDLLKKAVDSVLVQEIAPAVILFVHTPKVTQKEIKSALVGTVTHGVEYKFVTNKGESDFSSQVNLGAESAKTKYISILEFDDEYSKNYLTNVDSYLSAEEYKNTKCLLPLTLLVTEDNKTVGLINDAVWAQGFSEEMGKLDMVALMKFNSFMISGAIIDREAYLEVGGLKSDIKLYFNYEFLLRFVNSDFEVVSLPKFSYKHMIRREGSLFDQYANKDTGMTPDEDKFYFETAKKEYLFNPNEIQRVITYSKAVAE